jgi:CxxC motif-containing protein
MAKKILTCIGCPLGCIIEVNTEGERIVSIEGNNCPRGEAYARSELTAPMRTLTTTVFAGSGMLPVRTDKPVPKGLLFDCMSAINRSYVRLPVYAGDIVIANILNTGANVIATKNLL